MQIFELTPCFVDSLSLSITGSAHSLASAVTPKSGVLRRELMAVLAVCLLLTGRAPFGDAIMHVVRVCSQEEMAWVAARRIVASVADKRGWFSERQRVCNAWS